MEKKKIAFVVQRYGQDVNGGAEYHCRVLAEHMTKYYAVDVLTSTACSYTPWDNFYEAGSEIINDVCVRRFPVEKIRNNENFRMLSEKMRKGDETIYDEWIDEVGPCCPSFEPYLRENAAKYEAVIFFTYSYYLTYKGLKLQLDNSILLPTAHDEPGIYLPIYQELFHLPKAILYNSVEERQFILDKFKIEHIKSRLTCVGIDIPVCDEKQIAETTQKYPKDYIVYVGRVSDGKNYRELNRYFMEYKNRNPSELKLVVIGKVDEGMKVINSKEIIYTGFISEEEKTVIMKRAKILVMPSLYESLSLVILESMALTRPVIVNGRCEVLKGQCIRSNAGLYYTNYFEFEAGINYMLENPSAYEQMCNNGYRFVKDNYEWNKVVKNVKSLIEEIGN